MTRLMCTKDRKEIDWVKQELFRAGIRSEIRSNPVAQALRVTRLELWVQDERDFLRASKLYASIKAQPPELEDREQSVLKADHRKPGSGVVLDLEEVSSQADSSGRSGTKTAQAKGPGDLEQASRLLEQEIEHFLSREAELEEKCAALEKKVNDLSNGLTQCQEQLAQETATRTAAEKLAREVTESRNALEMELRDLKLLLKVREDAVAAAEQKAEALQQEMRGYVGNLSSIYSRLHAKNTGGFSPRSREGV